MCHWNSGTALWVGVCLTGHRISFGLLNQFNTLFDTNDEYSVCVCVCVVESACLFSTLPFRKAIKTFEGARMRSSKRAWDTNRAQFRYMKQAHTHTHTHTYTTSHIYLILRLFRQTERPRYFRSGLLYDAPFHDGRIGLASRLDII